MEAKQQSVTAFVLRRTLDAEGYGNELSRTRLVPALERSLKNLTAELEGGDLTRFGLMRKRSMEVAIRRELKELEGDWIGSVNAGRKTIARVEWDRATREMREALGQNVADSIYRVPTEQLDAILRHPIGGQFLQDWVARSLGSLEGRARQELGQSVILGETAQQAAARLRESFELSRRGAEVLARTSMMQSANEARDAALEEFDDVIDGWRWLATLDIRTCEVCGNLDGREYKTRGEITADPPVHPNCRCVLIPVTKFSGEGTRPKVTDETARTVRHRDGSTSTKWKTESVGRARATTTFREFFDSQPAGWKERYLGPARYKLYREGKIDLSDLARNNQPLTLSQLRERV